MPSFRVLAGLLIAFYGVYWGWSNQLKEPGGLVVLTGAGGLIGRESVLRLANSGYDVITTVRSTTDAEILTKSDKSKRITVVLADLTKPEGIAKVKEAVNGRPLAAIIHNAAITSGRIPVELDHDDHYTQMEAINQRSILTLTTALVEPLKAHGSGRIIFISSAAGEVVAPGSTMYSATKAAGEMLTIGMARELYLDDVKGIVVRPGRYHSTSPAKNYYWTEQAMARHQNSVYKTTHPKWWKNAESKAWEAELNTLGRDPQLCVDFIEYAVRAVHPPQIIYAYSWAEYVQMKMLSTILPAEVSDFLLYKMFGWVDF